MRLRKKRKRKYIHNKRNKFDGLKFIKYISFLSFIFYLFYKLTTNSYFADKVDLAFSRINQNKLYQELLHQTNAHIEKSNVFGDLSKAFLEIMTNINIDNPNSILANFSSINFPDDYGIVTDETGDDESEEPTENPVVEERPDIAIYDKTIPKNPIIYIYNTHQGEEYKSSSLSSTGLVPDVLTASYLLKDELKKLDIPTMVEDSDFIKFRITQGWSYADSYKVSRYFMDAAKSDQPSIKYYIDIHRDSVNYKTTTTTIDGKTYARFYFVLGLENPNYKQNLQLMQFLHMKITEKYPNLSKGILQKEGKGVNGVYNQDMSSTAILIEIGGVDNTLEEVDRSVEVLAKIIADAIEESE